jgi:hypothetical protein
MSLPGLTGLFFLITLTAMCSFSLACWLVIKDAKPKRRWWLVGAYVAFMSLFLSYVPFGYALFIYNWR